jgi:hypothetical protein
LLTIFSRLIILLLTIFSELTILISNNIIANNIINLEKQEKQYFKKTILIAINIFNLKKHKKQY